MKPKLLPFYLLFLSERFAIIEPARQVLAPTQAASIA